MRGFRENFFQKSPSLCRSLKGAIQQKSHLCYPAVKESLANLFILFNPVSPLFGNAYFIATGRVMTMVWALSIYMKIWAGFPKVPKENRPLEIQL